MCILPLFHANALLFDGRVCLFGITSYSVMDFRDEIVVHYS